MKSLHLIYVDLVLLYKIKFSVSYDASFSKHKKRSFVNQHKMILNRNEILIIIRLLLYYKNMIRSLI